MAYDFAGLASQAGMMFVIAVCGLLFLGIVWAAAHFYLKAKRFNISVVVWKRFKNEEGAEMCHIVDLHEKAAIIKDKKLKKWAFHLKKANIDLGEEELENHDENREIDMPSVPGNKGEVVFVEKLAERKYAVGQPFVVEGTVKIRVTQADQAEAIRSFDMNAQTFGKKDNVIWAFIAYITFAVLILILVVVVLNKIEILQEFGDRWLEGAQMLRSAAAPSTAPG